MISKSVNSFENKTRLKNLFWDKRIEERLQIYISQSKEKKHVTWLHQLDVNNYRAAGTKKNLGKSYFSASSYSFPVIQKAEPSK